MSSDHAPGAPSFGDLFEDPDSPGAPTEAPAEPAADRSADGSVAAAPQVLPAADDAADRAAHDLDHESAEAAHLVAGFEPADDADADDDADRADEAPRGDDADPVAPTAAPESQRPVVVAPAGAGVRPGSVARSATGAVTVSAAGAAPATPVVVAPDGAVSVPPVVRPWDGTVDPAVSSAPAGRVDTGRLYRSAGAEGPATLDAIPAIDPAHSPGRRVEVAAERPAKEPSGESGLTYSGVVVVVGAVTVLVAFAEALVRHEIGWMTGLALLASSVYAAAVVRRADIWAAVVVPPLAFLAAALTAGQLTLDKSGSLLIREGFSLFRTLATDAPWILGTTAVCLVIVLVRRRRA